MYECVSTCHSASGFVARSRYDRGNLTEMIETRLRLERMYRVTCKISLILDVLLKVPNQITEWRAGCSTYN